jgi:hypothetical protein
MLPTRHPAPPKGEYDAKLICWFLNDARYNSADDFGSLTDEPKQRIATKQQAANFLETAIAYAGIKCGLDPL